MMRANELIAEAEKWVRQKPLVSATCLRKSESLLYIWKKVFMYAWKVFLTLVQMKQDSSRSRIQLEMELPPASFFPNRPPFFTELPQIKCFQDPCISQGVAVVEHFLKVCPAEALAVCHIPDVGLHVGSAVSQDKIHHMFLCLSLNIAEGTFSGIGHSV